MEAATRLQLTAAGQPAMQADEVHYCMADSIDIYDRDTKSNLRRGVAIVTSHRLCWIDGSRRDAIGWHLSRVQHIAEEAGGVFVGSAKIVVMLQLSAPDNRGGPTRAPPSASVVAHVKLAFKAGGKDQFVVGLRTALARQSWLSQAIPTSAALLERGAAQGDATPIAQRVGIGGIMAAEKLAAESGKRVASDAFADLDALAKHARTLVVLSEGYAREAQALQQRPGRAAEPAAPAGTTPAAAAPTPVGLDALVDELGIVSSVSRAACGAGAAGKRLFLQEVARQIATVIVCVTASHERVVL